MAKQRLVLIHGFLESAAMWKYIVPRLSYRRNFNLSIPELPGHGNNAFLPKEFTMEAYCQNILEQLKLNDKEEMFIIGHSMGGYIGAHLAAMMPKRVSGLCFFQSRAGNDSDEKIQERKRAIEAARQNKSLYVRTMLTNCVLEANRDRLREELEHMIAEAGKMSFESISGAQQAMILRNDNVELLKDRKFPLYYFLSPQDTALPMDIMEKELAELPGAVAYYATNCAHFGYMEANREAVDFIKRIIMAA
ncbi:MAG TPA: alpha/beta hydrolase [Flavobacteriales bacterium]